MRPYDHVGEGATAFFLGSFAAASPVCAEEDCKERGRFVAAIVVSGHVMTIPLCGGHEGSVSVWFGSVSRQYVPDRRIPPNTLSHRLRGRSRMRAGNESV